MEDVTEILRPLAERQMLNLVDPHLWDDGVHACGPEANCRVPDTRFEALRFQNEENDPNYGMRLTVNTSLGAIMRAAAACGLYIDRLGPENIYKEYRWKGTDLSRWGATFSKSKRPFIYDTDCGTDSGFRAHGKGATPEEAAALALVAAVEVRVDV